MKVLIDKEGIKENGKPVEVTYAAFGGDNWPIVSCLLPQINGVPTVDYFTYFDKKTGKILYSYKQDWFKTMMKEYQGLVSEGAVSQESLIDNSTAFTEKLNSGHYAISMAWLKPDSAALKAAGKTYRYRFLWPNVTNGIRKYIDPDLEQNMCYDVDNKANIKYNLYNYNLGNESFRSAWPQYPLGYYAGKDHPKYMYKELARSGGTADTYYQPGMIPGMAREDRFVFVEQSDFFPSFGDQWNVFSKGRDAFEKSLTTVFAAKSDAQFEKLWNDFLAVAEEVGMTDANLEEVNKIFSKKSPNAIPDSAKITK